MVITTETVYALFQEVNQIVLSWTVVMNIFQQIPVIVMKSVKVMLTLILTLLSQNPNLKQQSQMVLQLNATSA